ncbi:MAG: phage major capsid protein [Candidatus Thermoplasmatota archaeon]|nr:phage major capsid protein [Candidatus Thermoplasmatota archaeon]
MDVKEAIAKLTSQMDETLKEIKSLVDRQDAEIKRQGQATEDTGKKLADATNRLDEISAELKEKAQKDSEAQQKLEEKLRTLEADIRKGQRLGDGRLDNPDNPYAFKTLGQAFVESDAYKEFDTSQGKSRRFEFKSFDQFLIPHCKSLSSGSFGDRYPALLTEALTQIYTPPERVERVRDLLPVTQTTQGAVEFIQETGFVNRAAPVPEFQCTEDEDLHVDITQKPKSELHFEVVTEGVKTIAHWLCITRQILEDLTMLRSYIDNRLIYGLKLTEDEQILYGSGTGDDIQGILAHPGIQTYRWSQGQANDTRIDAVRRAMTLATVAEYPIDGVVLHPFDWEHIELAKGSDQRYIWVNVATGGEARLWRAPVVETTAIRQNEFLTGSFRSTSLWDRREAAIRISDSHDKFFVKNLWAILAESRLCQTIYRPEGFVRGLFDAAPTSS